MRDVRYLIVHAPSPKWQPGLPFFEQVGIQEHIGHFRKLLEAGKLELEGPFLDEHAGGVMTPAEGHGKPEIAEFANGDPAVASGLLRVAVAQ